MRIHPSGPSSILKILMKLKRKRKWYRKECATSAVKPLINVLQFSKWLTLVRTVAWILRFAENIGHREADRQIRKLEPQELKKELSYAWHKKNVFQTNLQHSEMAVEFPQEVVLSHLIQILIQKACCL